MNMSKHNPDCKLISVFTNNKEIIYNESNNGENAGLEVYFYKEGYKPGDHFYYSRRYNHGKIPSVYSIIYRRLKALVNYCAAGSKLSIDNVEFNHIANLQGRYTGNDIIYKH